MAILDKIWVVIDEDFSAQTCDVYAQDSPDGFVDKPSVFFSNDYHQSKISAHMEKCAAICDDLGDEFASGGSPTSQAALKIASDRIRKELQRIELSETQP